MTKLAIVATHPIQYQAAWFRMLEAHPDLDLEVLYCHIATPQEQADAGFGVAFEWDIPLLEGYQYRILKNVAKNPSIHHFMGLNTPEIYNIIREENYDVVLILGWFFFPAWQTFWACKRTNTPIMVRGDSNLHYYRTYRSHSRILKWAKYLIYRQFITKFDACLAVGQWSRDYYTYYGAKKQNTFIVPHIIDEDVFDLKTTANNTDKIQQKADWNIAEDSFVVILSGKLIERKRPLDFVHAIDRASVQKSNIVGVVVGDGPLRADAEKLAKDQNIPIVFTGFINQTNLPGMYYIADVLVLPSQDTWGLVVNEAMLMETPCIISDQVGCGPDLIEEDKTGYIIPFGDIESLADRIVHLASDQELTKKMGVSARGKARQESQKAIDGIINAVQHVTENSKTTK